MGIYGYKSFDRYGKNINGALFETGIAYTVPSKAKFGKKGNGFHFALRLEDTLLKEGVNQRIDDYIIAYVFGDGDIAQGEAEQGSFKDLYAATKLTIIKFMTREEIIQYALKLPQNRMVRFVTYFRLNPDEISLFRGKHERVDIALDYYQLGIKNAFERIRKRPLN
jgi:hypothetical protein